jgi:hypothetical protein
MLAAQEGTCIRGNPHDQAHHRCRAVFLHVCIRHRDRARGCKLSNLAVYFR